MLGDYNTPMLIIKLFPMYQSLTSVRLLIVEKRSYTFKYLLCTKPLRNPQVSGEISPLFQPA